LGLSTPPSLYARGQFTWGSTHGGKVPTFEPKRKPMKTWLIIIKLGSL
jgi:hypothetical protein